MRQLPVDFSKRPVTMNFDIFFADKHGEHTVELPVIWDAMTLMCRHSHPNKMSRLQ